MADETIQNVFDQSNRLFDQVTPLRMRQQELADNFFVERADFTQTRNLGWDYAAHLTSSTPLAIRRDLANVLSTILRPQDKTWAVISTRNYESLDDAGKIWLEIGTKILRNAMYDPDACFARAISQHDDDLSVFGNAVVSCEYNARKRALLFRNWHLRDCVWAETPEGTVGRIDRKWHPTAAELNKKFKGNVSPIVQRALEKEPHKEFEVRHIFIPVEDYDRGKKNPAGAQYVSIFYEVETKHVLEEIPYKHEYYAVPRWKMIAGTQYAYSPCALLALPDARLYQDVNLTLLEAGQKAVDPPLLSRNDLLRGDVNLFAGGITPTDSEYDERQGKALTPVYDSRSSNIPIGFEFLDRIEKNLSKQFFLDKVGLPPMASGMSPLEVSERISEYVRGALPLLEPLEPESNSQICSLAFNVAFANGFFGDSRRIPRSLQGKNITFKFDNPLRDAMDKAKGQLLQEFVQTINNLAPIDQTVVKIPNAPAITRDVAQGLGVPLSWVNSADKVQALVAADAQKQQQNEMLTQLNQGADTAQKAGMAMQAMNEAQK